MKRLLQALEYLQNCDKNGNYMDILEEIEYGTTTIQNSKIECISILERWLVEDVELTDYITRNQIDYVINIIK